MGSQLPGPPARLVFRLSLFSPLCRSSSLCPEGGACPPPRGPLAAASNPPGHHQVP